MNLSGLLYVVAVLCFAVATLLSAGAFNGAHALTWAFGGLVAFAAAHLPTQPTL